MIFTLCIYFFYVVPLKDPPSLIFTNAANLQHIFMNGSLVRSNSMVKVAERTSFDYNHRNETICWVIIKPFNLFDILKLFKKYTSNSNKIEDYWKVLKWQNCFLSLILY